ncbi:hypothetical protein LSAT2_030047, partial [Lamellibrachia satsuma]
TRCTASCTPGVRPAIHQVYGQLYTRCTASCTPQERRLITVKRSTHYQKGDSLPTANSSTHHVKGGSTTDARAMSEETGKGVVRTVPHPPSPRVAVRGPICNERNN